MNKKSNLHNKEMWTADPKDFGLGYISLLMEFDRIEKNPEYVKKYTIQDCLFLLGFIMGMGDDKYRDGDLQAKVYNIVVQHTKNLKKEKQ